MPAGGRGEGAGQSEKGPIDGQHQSVRRRRKPHHPVVRKLMDDRTARLAGLFLLLMAGCAVAAPALAPADPLSLAGAPLEGPSRAHPFGTDGLGRDVLSRLLFGGRLTLGMGLAAAAAVTGIGLVVGLVAGYLGGLVDTLLMRVVDVVLTLPGLLAALAIAALLEPGLGAVWVGLVSVWWAGYARIVRGLVVSLAERPFIEGARAVGAGHTRVLFTHILPHAVPTAVVLATLDLGALVLAFAGLSFLGLGAQPPTPEWGAMLNQGRTYFLSAPQVMLVPGIALSLTVFAFNMLGDGVRDALDPTISGRT